MPRFEICIDRLNYYRISTTGIDNGDRDYAERRGLSSIAPVNE